MRGAQAHTLREPAQRLVHEHVAGLRFDGQLQYTIQSARGLRWRKLPGDEPNVGNTGGDTGLCRLVLAQALALLTGKPAPGTLLERMLRGGAHEASVRMFATGRHAVNVRAIDGDSPRLLLSALQHWLCGGRVGMLEFVEAGSRDAEARHWALVTGVELSEGCPGAGGLRSPRALLLLDPRLAWPWAVGHNARVELTGNATGWRYRTPDGALTTLAEVQGFGLGVRPQAQRG